MMNKFIDANLEEDFCELLNSNKISSIWYEACDLEMWENATWENFFTGKRAQVLLENSPYLPKYINMMNYIFKEIQKIQNFVQMGDHSEESFFDKLILTDYLALEYEKLLEKKYLLGTYYTQTAVYKTYKEDKIRSKNFSTPFIHATTKLLKLWIERRNLIILEEASEFSRKSITIGEFENIMPNLQQNFLEKKNSNFFKTCSQLQASVYVHSCKRKKELEDLTEKWYYNIRTICSKNFNESSLHNQYMEMRESLKRFDDTFELLDPNLKNWVVLSPIFKRYDSILDSEFDFIYSVKKNFASSLSFDDVKQIIDQYAKKYHLSKYRKKILTMLLFASLALLEGKLPEDQGRVTKGHLPSETIFEQSLEIEKFVTPYNSFITDSDFIEEVENQIHIGKYIEFENIYSYSNIYEEDPSGIVSEKGYIVAYFPYKIVDGQNVFFSSLRTAEELRNFIRQNKSQIDEIYWKVAFASSEHLSEIKAYMIENQNVPYSYTTYFVDYKPNIKTLKK